MEGVVSFLDVAFVALLDIVMEGVFEGEGEVLVGSLEFEGDGADDGPVGAPAHGDAPGSVEKSGPDFIGLEVLLDAALLHLPADDLDNIIGFVPDLNLMETIAIPIVALVHVSTVEVVLGVVVVPEVVGRVDEVGADHAYLIKIYLITPITLSIFTGFAKISLEIIIALLFSVVGYFMGKWGFTDHSHNLAASFLHRLASR